MAATLLNDAGVTWWPPTQTWVAAASAAAATTHCPGLGGPLGCQALDIEDGMFRFGPFSLLVQARTLLAHGKPVAVGSRAFDVLTALIRRQGALATKNELLDEVWPGVTVEENNLTTQVLNLRKLLAAHDPDAPYIATDPGRGYRFVGFQDGNAAVGPGDQPDQHVPTEPPRHNLPCERSLFVGRTRELADIGALLRGHRLVTLAGAGGVGKTRCSLRTGEIAVAEFQDGVWLVELASVQDGSLVAEALCRAIGAPIHDGRPAGAVAAAFLRQRRVLIILDNCEQVLEGSAALADDLLRVCPHVRILATSRQRLGIPGEAVYAMPSLPVPSADDAGKAASALRADSVRLFVNRAADAMGGYELSDEDAPAVCAICRRLDGMAMAIELAASRMRMLKPAEISARLENVFGLLAGGGSIMVPRHQTLRATLDWSHALLSRLEQVAFRRLAVFADGFSLEGSEAVACGNGVDPDDILDLLTALVDKSLVRADMSGRATRYRMAETTRLYARERLAASGDRGQARRLAEYLVVLFTRAEGAWGVTPTDQWLAAYCPEVENLRSAVDWAFRPASDGAEAADAALGIALVARAGSLATEMSLQPDMRRWAAAAMPHLTHDTAAGQAAWVLYSAAQAEPTFGVEDVSPLRARMIALFRQAGDTVGLSCALRTTGISMARAGDGSERALGMLNEAVSLLRPCGASKNLATALAHLGAAHYINGSNDAALALNEEALAMRRALGDRTGVAVSFLNLGEFAFARGALAEAVGHAGEAVTLARRHALQEILGISLCNLANYRLCGGDVVDGREAAQEALLLLRAIGNDDNAMVCVEHLALAHSLAGAAHVGARLLGFTDSYFTRTAQTREPSERIRYDLLLRTLAAALDSATQSACQTQGAGWSWDEAETVAMDSGDCGPPERTFSPPDRLLHAVSE